MVARGGWGRSPPLNRNYRPLELYACYFLRASRDFRGGAHPVALQTHASHPRLSASNSSCTALSLEGLCTFVLVDLVDFGWLEGVYGTVQGVHLT